ncbi:MAG: phage scaffolding protein [Clostridia bacterium]|nr:phage scaffolding protein [Clostridia bacterium]
MPDLSELFGEERLSYAELCERLSKAGLEYGDVGQLKAEFTRQMDDVRRSAALERELDRAKVKNRAIVAKILDMDRVTVGEDGAHGIAEQLDDLRRTDPYLFEQSERQPEANAPQQPGGMRFASGLRHTETAADPDDMSDAEYYRAVKKL